jgi:hypothetical protein
MSKRCVFRFSSLIVAAIAVGSTPLQGAETVDFAREVLPILSNKCFVCHGPDAKKKKDVLRLDSYAGATRDLDGYKAIDPANPAKSELIARIKDTKDPMPPEKAEKKLTVAERDILTRWVKSGGKYAKHWAFVPPKKSVAHKSIDGFIEAQLKKNKVTLAAEADRAVLARRVAYILTGLPPEPKKLAAFLADKSGEAYENFVDALTASSYFGEHQARYWLDAVRYGDTHGLHLDNKRGIYPYRDWVVYAFNNDLPLNDFITWQIAGDLLPNATLQQRVATGFVRMNPSTAEGGAIAAEFQAKNSFDRTENLGTVLLGMSLTCARCHTHKYDPIPQTEYYRLLAFFNSTKDHSMDGNKYTYAPVIKAPASQAAWIAWQKLEAEEKSGKGDKAKIAAAKKELEKKFTTTLVAQELGKPRVTKVLNRGEYNLPIGEPLKPGIVTVMGAFPKDAPRNRLGLAKWLTSPEHPLVARVLINRIWQRTLGYALVRTPEDFGLQGQQPTHPELLDWLAVELRDSGWNLKHMLKLMVMSKTFRQSSVWRQGIDDPKNKLFARGSSYRLDAETLRDTALWASGLLRSEMGGEGVKPYQPPGLWRELAHPGSNTKKYVLDKGDKIYRRSLYVYWKRTSPHPMMLLFDAPNRESSCVRRSRSNTPLQSLGLLNEIQRTEMSRKLAERLIRESKTDAQRLTQLFNMLACRKPTAAEKRACGRLLTVMKRRYAASEKDAIALLSVGAVARDPKLKPAEVAAWTQVASTVLASDVSILLY